MADEPAKKSWLHRLVSEVVGVAALIGGVALLGAFVAGFAWWQGWISIAGTRGPGSNGSIANGATCSRDRDCVSGYCSRPDKRCASRLRKGDVCTRDRDCESNHCGFATVGAARETCR